MKNTFLAILALFIYGCKTKTVVEPVSKPIIFSNVLILGNSITQHPQDLSIGWAGDWGMAASAADKDYVHLLTKRFQTANQQSNVKIGTIAGFEYDSSNFNFDTNLKTFRDTKPDLLILRIGENVQPNTDTIAFDKNYQALISYMRVNNPNLHILAVGSFWPGRDYVNHIMAKYTPYVSLEPLGISYANYAIDLTGVSDGVKQHPNDKGMQGIADIIWSKVITLQ